MPRKNKPVAALTKYSCPYCQETFDAFEAIKSHILTGHPTESLPEPEGTIHLTINGQKYKFQVEPDWTLHYLIHDRLGLTGTKLMCDRGACGSCTVIVNGRPDSFVHDCLRSNATASKLKRLRESPRQTTP